MNLNQFLKFLYIDYVSRKPRQSLLSILQGISMLSKLWTAAAFDIVFACVRMHASDCPPHARMHAVSGEVRCFGMQMHTCRSERYARPPTHMQFRKTLLRYSTPLTINQNIEGSVTVTAQKQAELTLTA